MLQIKFYPEKSRIKCSQTTTSTNETLLQEKQATAVVLNTSKVSDRVCHKLFIFKLAILLRFLSVYSVLLLKFPIRPVYSYYCKWS